jgi:sugar (pentulose or hexulose) kinase
VVGKNDHLPVGVLDHRLVDIALLVDRRRQPLFETDPVGTEDRMTAVDIPDRIERKLADERAGLLPVLPPEDEELHEGIHLALDRRGVVGNNPGGTIAQSPKEKDRRGAAVEKTVSWGRSSPPRARRFWFFRDVDRALVGEAPLACGDESVGDSGCSAVGPHQVTPLIEVVQIASDRYGRYIQILREFIYPDPAGMLEILENRHVTIVGDRTRCHASPFMIAINVLFVLFVRIVYDAKELEVHNPERDIWHPTSPSWTSARPASGYPFWTGRAGTIAVHRRANAPTFGSDGSAEQDPTTWPSITLELLREATESSRENGRDVIGVAVTAQRSSVIPLDAAGVALRRAIMWQDKRPGEVCRELTASEERHIYRKTGVRVLPVFSAPKIAWIARHEPAVAAASKRYVGVLDLVLHALSGRFATDRSFAGRSLLYNLHTGEWDEELLEFFNVSRHALSDLCDPGDVVGGIDQSAAAATGLPVGLPVISAGGDQQCAALGMGLVGPDRIVVNTGTGSYVLGLSETPQIDDEMRFFCNPAATKGHFTVEASIPTTGSAYRWLNGLLFNTEDPDDFAAINRAAEAAPSGANGVTLVPHLQGAGTPSWDGTATGALSGITLATSPSDIARAMLEGIVSEIVACVGIVSERTGRPEVLTNSGGLASFPLFSSILSRETGISVRVPSVTESTSQGAWAMATTTLGWYASPAAAIAAIDPEA